MAFTEEDKEHFINNLDVAYHQMSHPEGREASVNISAISLAQRVYGGMHKAVRNAEKGYLDVLCDYITEKFGKNDAREVRRRMDLFNK